MNKNILILLIMLVLYISFSNAISTIVVDETELISLKTEARDEDNDVLSYSFTGPMDEEGKWQTAYGDAGEYKVTVTVSDGTSSTSQDVLLVVKKKNVAPSIESFTPEESEVVINEGESIDFSVEASDLNKDPISYIWKLDGKQVSEENSYIYKPGYWDSGTYNIEVVVSDGEANVDKKWGVKVNDFDRSALLDGIGGFTVKEGEVLSLELPDFEEYNLEYTISDPVGNDNRWETGYSDEGTYAVEIAIKDGEFNASKTIDATVLDVDRPFVFKPIANAMMEENQMVSIELDASDPDGDLIGFSAESLPSGASLKGNKFEWVPGYDTVTKGNSLEKVLDKFHLLYMPFKIVFIAKSKGVEQRQSVLITVKDVNRKPVLEDIPTINVKEGEQVLIEPKAVDPDGDSISYYYSGWMDMNNYTTNYEDAGKYKIGVVASDGFLEDEKFVSIEVEDVNRAPVFGDIGKVEVYENEKLTLELYATDPDGDSVNISAELLPNTATVEDNIFMWAPDYDTVINGPIGIFVIDFKASDGNDEVVKSVNITVYNVNRAPRITEAGPKNSITVKNGETQKFKVVADDADGDELTYTWKFGILEQYVGYPLMSRNFSSLGDKKVKVVVSDGKEESEYEWNVNVIEKAKPQVIVEKPKEAKKVIEKEEVKKKPVSQPTTTITPPKEPEKRLEGDIYDKYTIVHVDGEVIGESKESFIVWKEG